MHKNPGAGEFAPGLVLIKLEVLLPARRSRSAQRSAGLSKAKQRVPSGHRRPQKAKVCASRRVHKRRRLICRPRGGGSVCCSGALRAPELLDNSRPVVRGRRYKDQTDPLPTQRFACDTPPDVRKSTSLRGRQSPASCLSTVGSTATLGLPSQGSPDRTSVSSDDTNESAASNNGYRHVPLVGCRLSGD
jgi:hypothetical protein